MEKLYPYAVSLIRIIVIFSIPYLTRSFGGQIGFVVLFIFIWIFSTLGMMLVGLKKRVGLLFLAPFDVFFYLMFYALYYQLIHSAGVDKIRTDGIVYGWMFISSVIANKFFDKTDLNTRDKSSITFVRSFLGPFFVFVLPIALSIPILFIIIVFKAFL